MDTDKVSFVGGQHRCVFGCERVYLKSILRPVLQPPHINTCIRTHTHKGKHKSRHSSNSTSPLLHCCHYKRKPSDLSKPAKRSITSIRLQTKLLAQYIIPTTVVVCNFSYLPFPLYPPPSLAFFFYISP